MVENDYFKEISNKMQDIKIDYSFVDQIDFKY